MKKKIELTFIVYISSSWSKPHVAVC